MAENKLLSDSSLSTVIDKNASLADAARAAGDYDNGTELDLFCRAYLTVQYDTTAPSSGDIVADLYVLHEKGSGTSNFPNGGDGTVGNDFTPQGALYVGSFEAVDPSTTVDEILELPNIPLSGNKNRFVLVNKSGQTFDSTWQLEIEPEKFQSA